MNTCKRKVLVMKYASICSPQDTAGDQFLYEVSPDPGFGPLQSTPKYLSNTFLYACNEEYSSKSLDQ